MSDELLRVAARLAGRAWGGRWTAVVPKTSGGAAGSKKQKATT
jgi:hypothetical protein